MIQTDLSSFSYKKGSLCPACKRCGQANFWKSGKNKQGTQRYRCKNCKCRFVWTSDLLRRNFFSSIITFAVELYTSQRMCASLRGVACIVKKAFNVLVSHQTIRQWVKDTKKEIPQRERAATTWHADETYIKIKGVGHWLWIVRCRDTGEVLSWLISKGRFFKHAKKLFEDALEVTGCRPIKVITDGLYQYGAALYKVMGWHWTVHKERHIIDSGIGKNWFIERLNREIKRRIKWFSTFQSLEGAHAFFGLWFYHHNTQ
jgi:transposase-like protein